MSTMSLIKNKASIFEGYDFQNDPFETNDKFSVYIPKERDTLSSLVKKAQDPKYRENAFRSPFYSPQQTSQKFFPGQQADILGASKFRANLEADLQKAKLYETEGNKGEDKNDLKEVHKRQVSVADPVHNDIQLGRTPQTEKASSKKKVLIKQLVDAKKIEQFKDSLYFDERTKTLPKTTLKNKVVEDLVNQYDSLMKNRDLLDYVYKIKGQNLLKNQRIKVEKTKGMGKFNFVYNDYHLRETNPGFARNTLGTFFTR